MEKDSSTSRKKAGVAIPYQTKQALKQRIKETRTFCNDKGVNPRRGYNNHKHLHTQHRSLQVYIKQILMDIKAEINSNMIIGDFNIPLTSMMDHPDGK